MSILETINLNMKTVTKQTLVAESSSDTATAGVNTFIHLTVPKVCVNYRIYQKVVLKIKQVTKLNYPLVVKESTDKYFIREGYTQNAIYEEIDGVPYRIIDITEVVNRNQNNTLYLDLLTENNNEIKLYTNKSNQNAPKVEVIETSDYDFYKKQALIEENISQNDFLHLNIRTGKMDYTYYFTDYLYLKYNIFYGNTNTISGKNTSFPNGFKLNFQEYVNENNDQIKYIDQNFLTHTFKKTTENSNIYYEEDGNYLILKKEKLVDNSIKYTIYDSLGNKKEFNNNGYLIKIINAYGKETIITYNDDNKISSIVVSNGFTIDITYKTGQIDIKITPDGSNHTRTYSLVYTGLYLGEIKEYTYSQGVNNHSTKFDYLTINDSLILLALKPTPKKYLNKITSHDIIELNLTYDDLLRIKEVKKRDKIRNTNITKHTLTLNGLYTQVKAETENDSREFVYTFKDNNELHYSYELLTLNGTPNITNGLVYDMSKDGLIYTFKDTLKKLLQPIEITNYTTTNHEIKLENKSYTYKKIKGGTNIVLVIKLKVLSEILDNQNAEKIEVSLYDNTNNLKDKVILSSQNTNYQFACFLYELPEFEGNDEFTISLYVKIKSKYQVKIYNYELIDKIETPITYLVVDDNTEIELNKPYALSYKENNEEVVIDGHLSQNDIIQNIYNYHINLNPGSSGFWYNSGKNFLNNVTSVKISKGSTNTIDLTNTMKLKKILKQAGLENTSILEYVTNDDVRIKLKETINTNFKVYDTTKTIIKWYNKRGKLLKQETTDKGYIKGESHVLNNLDQVVIKYAKTKDNKTLQVESYDYDEYGVLNQTSEYVGDNLERNNYSYDEFLNLLYIRNSENQTILHNGYNNIDELSMVYNPNYENDSVFACNQLLYNEVLSTLKQVKLNNLTYNFEYDAFERITKITKEVKQNEEDIILDVYEFTYTDSNQTTTIKLNNIEISKIKVNKLGLLIKQDDVDYIYENATLNESHGKLKEIKNDKYKIKYTYQNDEIYNEELVTNHDEEITDDESLFEITRKNFVVVDNPEDKNIYNINMVEYVKKDPSTNKFDTFSKVREVCESSTTDIGSLIVTTLNYPRLSETSHDDFRYQEIVKPFDGEYREVQLNATYITDNAPTNIEHNHLAKLTYKYYTKNKTILSNYISGEEYQVFKSNGKKADDIGFNYTYNNKGLLSKKVFNLADITTYTYDDSNRLTKEKNELINSLIKEINYTYDESNNILSKIINNGTTTKTINYTYDPNDKDKLLSYDNKSITYDILGRVIKYYKDNKEYNVEYYKQSLIKKITIYQNEELEKVIEYSYDPLGNLIKEEVYEGTSSLTLVRTYNFYYDGQKLIREEILENNEREVLDYIYAESGLVGIRNNDKIYHLYHNIFGDVISIYDKEYKICTYNYTAYGETTIKNEERNGIPLSRISERSSIRYRGYQIDKETGLYLLKTRCYNSEWGRFITKDTIDYLEPDKVYGLNLYAYCMNDPINYSDPSGHITISLIVGLIASFVIGTTASAISQYVQYGNVNWLQAGVDGMFAVASTALAYTGIGLVGSIVAGAGMGLAQYTLDSTIFHNDFSWSGALIATGLGALGGLASGRGAQHFKSIGSNLDDTGRTGVKAILSAFNKYGTGTGYQKVMNLWGGRVANSLAKSISQNFTKSVLIIWGTTIATYVASCLLGKVDWKF